MIVGSLLAIVLSSNFVVAIVDAVPRYDVNASCSGLAKSVQERQGAVSQTTQERTARCVKTEEDARAKLTAEWPRFDAAERASCIGASSAGGTPSYVELLVCLGMKLEVRKLRSKP